MFALCTGFPCGGLFYYVEGGVSIITLHEAALDDAEKLFSMQVQAFYGLLEKYRDYDTNPAAEPLEKTVERLQDERSHFFFILVDGDAVGGIRIQEKSDSHRIGMLYILPESQGNGYAQQAVKLAENLYPQEVHWELDTILQESKLCYLYEKLGYHKTGIVAELMPGMALVHYEKNERMEENGNL